MEKEQVIAYLFTKLREHQYAALQYIPTRKSIFGLFKESQNLLNLFKKQRHLMFYFSAFPDFYLKRVLSSRPGLAFYYRFCFLNELVSKQNILDKLGDDWLKDALRSKVLFEKDEKYGLTFSVLPVRQYLILRDLHQSYKFHEYDDQKPVNRVYVGADSVKFVEYNQHYLNSRKYNHALELGCGTGIQLITIENLADKLTGIDINPRAVEFTELSAKLNGLHERVEAKQSDLFENITRKYDLILANPWFLDLEKGGLEEIPSIIEKLDQFMEVNGTFAIYFGSYVKDGIDQARTLLTRFAKERHYDVTFFGLGRTIEPHFLDRYKKLNISHINSYYAKLTKGGSGTVTVHDPSALRKVRDAIYIPLQRLLSKLR
ncbi:MAG: methyltransferase [Bacteroidota bacterium]